MRLWQRLATAPGFPAFLRITCRRASGFFAAILTGAAFRPVATDEYDRLVHTTDSVIHCAASLNRKSEKSCLNVNLRGRWKLCSWRMRAALITACGASVR